MKGIIMSKKEKELKPSHKTSIGGQALIEGVMMRGPKKIAMAVRTQSGEIDVEEWAVKDNLKVVKKIPLVRGVVSFFVSMIDGYKTLMKSAEKAGIDEEEEKSKFEIWLDERLGDNVMKVLSVIAGVLGALIAVVLFMYLPAALVKLLDKYVVALGGFKPWIEGLIKITLFVIYIALVSKMEMMHRVFQYHGAEHKTIFCYEHGLELNVENVKKQSRFHPRCGTSFIILVLILGILVFSVVSWESLLIRTLIKLALLPLIMGIAYELIKIAGRYDNFITKIISYPGVCLQHLTTAEPDESQIEVAIASMNPVIPENKEEDKW